MLTTLAASGLDTIIQLDTQALLAVNGAHTPLLDTLMPWITWKWTWVPFYIALYALMAVRFGWLKALFWLAVIGAAIAAADQLCSSLLRPMFARMRPSNPDNPIEPLVTLVNGYRSGRYGFPSSHAANTAALAALYALIMRRRWVTWMMIVWALIVDYSRAYLGVHYPGDLLVGACLGAMIGAALYIIGAWLEGLIWRPKRATSR